MGDTPVLDIVILENPLSRWVLAIGIAIGVVLLLRTVTGLLVRRLKGVAERTGTDLDDLFIELLEKTKRLFIVLLALWLGSHALDLVAEDEDWFLRALGIGLLFQGGLWATGLVNYFLRRYRRKQEQEDPSLTTALGAIGFVAKTVVWAVFLLLILQNLGVEITALLAGVSVGGIAVALAVQNVLGDLFSSLSIVLDKPFEVGDFIIVGDFMGAVENVGLKSTRVRSLSGEQLVFSNSDLLSSRIRNYKRMQERRAVFKFGVTYDTPPDMLERIPTMVRETVEEQELTRFDRSHFQGFGDFALNFETVYYLTVPDYNAFMDVQQAINLELCRLFDEQGIEFAFPTQTIHLHNGS
jgi:small-conductance mechanosensitive channel